MRLSTEAERTGVCNKRLEQARSKLAPKRSGPSRCSNATRWASSLITVVKQILGHHVTVGGEPHSGWLPEGATTPLPTAARDVAFNITIEFDGSSYFLCYASEDGTLANDT